MPRCYLSGNHCQRDGANPSANQMKLSFMRMCVLLNYHSFHIQISGGLFSGRLIVEKSNIYLKVSRIFWFIYQRDWTEWKKKSDRLCNIFLWWTNQFWSKDIVANNNKLLTILLQCANLPDLLSIWSIHYNISIILLTFNVFYTCKTQRVNFPFSLFFDYSWYLNVLIKLENILK